MLGPLLAAPPPEAARDEELRARALDSFVSTNNRRLPQRAALRRASWHPSLIMWDGGGADSDDDEYVYEGDDDAMDVAIASDDDDMGADDGRPVVPAYDEKARLAEALEESKQDTGSNAVAVDPAFAADPAAPPLHDASATLAAAVAPEPAAQPVQSALATPPAAAAARQLEPPTIDDEEPKVGSKVWWRNRDWTCGSQHGHQTKSQSRKDAKSEPARESTLGHWGVDGSWSRRSACWHPTHRTPTPQG